MLVQGARVQIGDGTKTSVWNEKWIPSMPPQCLTYMGQDSELRVSDLIHQPSRRWDQSKFDENFDQRDQHLIKSLKLSRFNTEDAYIWPFVSNGKYTVKLGYWAATLLYLEGDMIVPREGSVILKQKNWKMKILPKIQQFLWRVVSGAVPTATRLCTRGIFIDPTIAKGVVLRKKLLLVCYLVVPMLWQYGDAPVILWLSCLLIIWRIIYL